MLSFYKFITFIYIHIHLVLKFTVHRVYEYNQILSRNYVAYCKRNTGTFGSPKIINPFKVADFLVKKINASNM